ncbi:MAG: hypothetical protein JO076_16345 [Verrucomicrobia bacterium]|nr:hypothetical protein [Verrucomicrobiota bacterium]
MMTFVLITGFFSLTLINYVLSANSRMLRELTAYVAQVDHMDSFSRGIVDSRALLFYPSVAVLVLVITYHVFQYRRWKG